MEACPLAKFAMPGGEITKEYFRRSQSYNSYRFPDASN